MVVKRIKNNTNAERYFAGQGILPDAYYTIDPEEDPWFIQNLTLEQDILDGYAVMNDGTSDFTNPFRGVDFLNAPLRVFRESDTEVGTNFAFVDTTDLTIEPISNATVKFGVVHKLPTEDDGYSIGDALTIDFGEGLAAENDGYGTVTVNVNLEAFTSESPGFTWGDSGTNKNTYLLNDTVPSNKSGRLVPLDGDIVAVSVVVEKIPNSGAEIFIQTRVGEQLATAVFTTVVTVPLSDTSRQTVYLVPTPINAPEGTELCCLVGGVSVFGPVVSVTIRTSL